MALFSNLGSGDLATMQAQLDEQRAAAVGKSSANEIYKQMAYQAGSGLTRGIGGLLGADMIDPELKRRSLRARIVGEINPEDDASLKAGVAKLQQAGFADDAFALSARLLEREKEKSIISKNLRERQSASLEEKTFVELAKKATPASVAAAQRAGNDISLLEIPETVKVSTYGQVLKDAGFKEGTPEFQAKMKAFAEAELESTKKGRGTNITNVLPKSAKDITELRKDVQALTKPYQDQSDAAETAIEFADMALKDNFASFAALRQSLAKAAGDTQISNRDVQAFGIDPSLVGTVTDTISRLSTGTPTKDTINKLKQVALALKKKADARIKLEEDQTIATARASGNYPKEQLDTLFRRRPAQGGGGANTRTTRSGVKYTVEND